MTLSRNLKGNIDITENGLCIGASGLFQECFFCRRLKKETGNALPVSRQQSRGRPAATEYNYPTKFVVGEVQDKLPLRA